ncbi:N-acetylmuramoyl-L-alanine amidase [Paenibacillus sp. BSR1-1]|uniref:N-acetylmuramoyl-L-alanine amidase n=1 Tax=Paenibacillus sp. BSR1-1 TaxID=3020845 RepID=UPI0025AF8212|nr:N-acetylmuramoyl-L-alanine amidase [Paenibacillus sp. BSR1-1]MDN3017152.1 N-acetylmuramoyl-L-alanine amidase [Paenibacillus sp. BSR1-1]
MITTRMKNILAVLSVFVLLLIFFIPLQREHTAYANMFSPQVNATSNENIVATVEATVLRVRENPSLFSKVVGRLKMGAKITIQEEQSGWAKMVSSSGIQGWVYGYYITKDSSSEAKRAIASLPSTRKIVRFNEKGQIQSTESISGIQTTVPFIAQNSFDPLQGKTIVLDPGHGGKDDGTTSIAGTHEKSLTLSTAEAVKQILENAGANVIMTRTGDTYVPLLQRVAVSYQNHADAFISFHYNWSSDPSVNGITNFYYQQTSNPLASDIINEVVQATGLNNDGTRFDNLSVLRNNSQPSTLIELGFLSNKNDDSVVESSAYRDKVAKGVYLGLLDYFQSNNK